jgi:hypothetical protein
MSSYESIAARTANYGKSNLTHATPEDALSALQRLRQTFDNFIYPELAATDDLNIALRTALAPETYETYDTALEALMGNQAQTVEQITEVSHFFMKAGNDYSTLSLQRLRNCVAELDLGYNQTYDPTNKSLQMAVKTYGDGGRVDVAWTTTHLVYMVQLQPRITLAMINQVFSSGKATRTLDFFVNLINEFNIIAETLISGYKAAQLTS